MEAKQRVRRDYLDIAKAITIFIVIIGHAVGNTETPLYRCIIYTFHMPLFFIVSGVVLHLTKLHHYLT